MEKTNILLISTQANAFIRCSDLAKEFNYSFSHISDCTSITHLSDVIILTTENYKTEVSLKQDIMKIRQLCPDSFFIISISPKLNLSFLQSFKKLGADSILLDSDFYNSSKLEFVAFQKIKTSHIAIKPDDLKIDSTINCFIYHKMPLNQQYMPILWPNETLTEHRLAKVSKVKNIFIQRKELKLFQDYKNQQENPDIKACRVRFLSLMNSYFELMLFFCDHSEYASFKKGNDLLEACVSDAAQLIPLMKDIPNIWPIFSATPTGQYGSIERVPIVATLAAHLSCQSKMGNPLQTLVAALVADLGMLFLAPHLARRIRNGLNLDNLNKLDLDEYRKHPSMSLVAALSRKMDLTESQKQIVLRTHERVDQTGFPHKPNPDSIPLEAMLIHYSELEASTRIDGTQGNQNTVRVPGNDKLEHSNIFSIFFIVELQKSLKSFL